MQKVCNENKEINDACIKNDFNGRKWFINHTRGTGETDHYEMLVNDS